jgi:tRNA pseudouridine55 synthase
VLVDKPAGPTSHDVVAQARRALGVRSIGHTGTLDPFASGLLVLMTGKGTRLARFVEQQSKRYLATARLGVRTTTDDLTGEVVGAVEAVEAVSTGRIAEALRDMVGAQQQVPPAYSAKKVAGERSYRKARRGEVVELAPVSVTVHSLDLVSWEPPLLTFRVVVSPGTYVRSLARDLGERLGTGAHLVALRREAIGGLEVSRAVPVDEIAPDRLLSLRSVVEHLPARELEPAERVLVGHGRPVARTLDAEGPVLLVQGDELVAVARVDGDQLQPVVVLEGA